jgi:lysyl-tRNA synthetase class 2
MFFVERGYLEVETPQLIPAPAPEVHIDAVSTDAGYLHTSPELCMKRMLAAGFSRIFQISKCFRADERGERHLPEFCLLEWYRTAIDYSALMEECRELLLYVAAHLDSDGKISYQGKEIVIKGPWKKISVNDAFDRYASVTLKEALEKKCFDEVIVNEIEPRLVSEGPVFLYDYPASLAALARRKPDDPRFAERFEIYIAGLEVANGFSELTDTKEQRDRFEREIQNRLDLGKSCYPMPEKFLASLEKMPEAAGVAVGVDRLAMIFSDTSRIDDVVTFTPEEL